MRGLEIGYENVIVLEPRHDQPIRNDNQYPPNKGKFNCQDPNNGQPKEFAGK